MWRRTIRCDRILPLRARQTLLRHQAEAVAGGAGIEGLVAALAGRELFRAFLARGERRLRHGRRNPGTCRPGRSTQTNAASSDQHGDAVHRVAAIALRVPVAGHVRLHRAVGSRWRAPRSRNSRRSAVSRSRSSAASRSGSSAVERGAAARSRRNRSRRRRCLTVRSPAQAAPRSFSSLVPAANFVPLAGLVMMERTGIDSRIVEVLPIGLVARHHRLDGDAIGELRHARAVVLLVAQRDAGQPLLRHRAGPARHDQAHRPAVDVRQRLAVHRPHDQVVRSIAFSMRHAARDRWPWWRRRTDAGRRRNARCRPPTA